MNTHAKGRGVCHEMWRILLVAGAALVCVAPIHAVDGVIEISQACAENTGCFSGDSAGFPVVITNAGSYRLTTNLDVPGDRNGIQINADDVTLDLNGFNLVSAGGVGSEDGIRWFTQENIEIRNGTVRGFPEHGITSGNSTSLSARVIGVRAIGNGARGLDLQGVGHLADGCTALNNGTGIFTSGGGALVINSVASGNTNFGLHADVFTGYRSNVLTDNNGGNANPQLSGGLQLGANLCGNALCP